MTNYETPELVEVGLAHDVVLGQKLGGSEIVPPEEEVSATVIDTDE